MRTLIAAAADKLECDPNVIAAVVETNDPAHPDATHRVTLATGTELYLSLAPASDTADPADDVVVPVVDTADMSKADLVAAANAAGITGAARMSKAELVVALESFVPDADGESADGDQVDEDGAP